MLSQSISKIRILLYIATRQNLLQRLSLVPSFQIPISKIMAHFSEVGMRIPRWPWNLSERGPKLCLVSQRGNALLEHQTHGFVSPPVLHLLLDSTLDFAGYAWAMQMRKPQHFRGLTLTSHWKTPKSYKRTLCGAVGVREMVMVNVREGLIRLKHVETC